jgi:hypothetical protein
MQRLNASPVEEGSREGRKEGRAFFTTSRVYFLAHLQNQLLSLGSSLTKLAKS